MIPRSDSIDQNRRTAMGQQAQRVVGDCARACVVVAQCIRRCPYPRDIRARELCHESIRDVALEALSRGTRAAGRCEETRTGTTSLMQGTASWTHMQGTASAGRMVRRHRICAGSTGRHKDPAQRSGCGSGTGSVPVDTGTLTGSTGFIPARRSDIHVHVSGVSLARGSAVGKYRGGRTKGAHAWQDLSLQFPLRLDPALRQAFGEGPRRLAGQRTVHLASPCAHAQKMSSRNNTVT